MRRDAMELLPGELKAVIGRLAPRTLDGIEELRIREGRPLEIVSCGQSRFACEDGTLHRSTDRAYRPGREVCRQLLERITNHSLYAMEEELRRGYITVPGGHRIGLAGRTVLEGGKVRGLREVGGFNFRIARARVGAALPLLSKIVDWPKQTVRSTLILGPPQQGKTTVIRDLARAISSGEWGTPAAASWGGRKVGIVDERSEIAASIRGVPAFDVGPRTDVMDACPKAEGMMMLLRSMSPEVLIVDEIGRPEDADAIREASHAGVRVIATAHAYDLQDAMGRPALRQLLEDAAFETVVLLRRGEKGVRFEIDSLDRHAQGHGRRAREPSGEVQAIARGHPGPQTDSRPAHAPV
ncbi:stage III sporulation protein AA [Paenibacillus sp. IB182496]|uniref:Stage III sporulation protein AA n=1 Tax=Paenibacillus sabuli TaxID=2772509 RepID=A0A927BXK7_9BACL|nr:stage III sporulation protein AA [Paenibacillus sabuli]MBD2847284.1 stage III sporulation protein AA [Paenibacillus sabuli]